MLAEHWGIDRGPGQEEEGEEWVEGGCVAVVLKLVVWGVEQTRGLNGATAS